MFVLQNKVAGMLEQKQRAYRILLLISNQSLEITNKLEILNRQARRMGKNPYFLEIVQTASSLSLYTASCLFLIYIDITANMRK